MIDFYDIITFLIVLPLVYTWVLIVINLFKIITKKFVRLFLIIKHPAKHLLKDFVSQNIGVTRLCLVAGLFGCIILSTTQWKCGYKCSSSFFEHFEWYSILYLAIAFCTPFIVSKIIEYITDGFRQEQEIL